MIPSDFSVSERTTSTGALAEPAVADFIGAARRAFDTVVESLASGAWEPDPDRHPDFMLDRLEEALRDTDFGTRSSDYARTEDLLQTAFAAMDAGDWTGAGPDTVGRLQSASFLAQLLSDTPEIHTKA
jgi:hypothetical protein